jgi:uncharacterized membrane-anchored protein YitT (DUF2179 family)
MNLNYTANIELFFLSANKIKKYSTFLLLDDMQVFQHYFPADSNEDNTAEQPGAGAGTLAYIVAALQPGKRHSCSNQKDQRAFRYQAGQRQPD